MGKIDYSKSTVGEIYPLGYYANKFGHLGFIYSKGPVNVPEFKCNAYKVKTTDLGNALKFKWKITPLENGQVLITGTHPRKQSNVILGITSDPFVPVVMAEERPLPVNDNEVLPRNRFTMNFVEGTPLFFEIRASNQCYFTASMSDLDYDTIDNDVYFIVNCWYGDDIKNHMRSEINLFNWYFDVDNLSSNKMMLKNLKNIPYEAISKRIGITIDEEYLKKLTS